MDRRVDPSQPAKLEQEMLEKQKNQDMESKDGMHAKVGEALPKPCPQAEPSEQGLQDDETGRGGRPSFRVKPEL